MLILGKARFRICADLNDSCSRLRRHRWLRHWSGAQVVVVDGSAVVMFKVGVKRWPLVHGRVHHTHCFFDQIYLLTTTTKWFWLGDWQNTLNMRRRFARIFAVAKLSRSTGCEGDD